jgi:hypothetical protein
VYIWITLFSNLLFFQQEACQEVLCEQEASEIMSECHPSYLKTVLQQVVCRIWTHSLRFLAPNTAVLVGIIQINTKFGWLKWLHTKKTYIWEYFKLNRVFIHPSIQLILIFSLKLHKKPSKNSKRAQNISIDKWLKAHI